MARLPFVGRKNRSVTASAVDRQLTASATRLTKKKAAETQRIAQVWQSQAFFYYESIGEVWFAAQFYARMLAPLRLYVGEMDDEGEITESKDPKAKAILSRIRDPAGGQSGLLGTFGRLRFLAGECYLIYTVETETDDEGGASSEKWEMVSTDELRVNADGSYVRLKAPGLTPEQLREPPDEAFEPLPGTAVVYRLWRRHPRFSDLADSPMRGVLEICEELLILTRTVRGRARSRLAGPGILAIPNEISKAPPEPVGDEDPEVDIFLEDLTDAIVTPIEDEGSAAGQVPLIVRGPAQYLAELRHIQIHDPHQTYPETGLRREAIERLALGLDFPPEVLLGIADANHWSGWQIDEQTWKAHGRPVAQELCDDLTSAYLRPNAREENIANWDRLVVAYDPAAVINHPDRSKDAKDLHTAGAIGDSALREAAGFTDDDAQTEEELWRWIGVRIRDASLAMYGIPSLRSGSELEPTAGELEVPPSPNGEVTVDDGTSSPAVTKEPPGKPTQTDERAAATAAALVSRILGAADLSLLRAREAAGNRIRNYAKRDANRDELARLIEGVRPGLIAPTLGQERVAALACPKEIELVSGAHELIVDAFRLWGIPTDVARQVALRLEQHAARTLYDEHPAALPGTFPSYVLGLLGSEARPAARSRARSRG